MQKFIMKLTCYYYHIISWLLPTYTANKIYKLFNTPQKHIPRAYDSELISHATQLTIDFMDYKIHGYQWGNGTNLVLLAHGWNSHPLAFRRIIKALLASGKTVLAFDAPAHGLSSGKYMNAIVYTKFLHQVMLEYKPTQVIGHSMGGSCLLFVLSMNKLRVEKAIIISSPPDYTCVVYDFLALFNLSPRALAMFMAKLNAEIGCCLEDFSVEQCDPYFDQVGLRIHDKNDRSIPYSEGERLQQQWHGVESYITHGLGHNGVLKDKKVVDKIIDYLK